MNRRSEDVLIHPLSYVREVRGWTYQDVVDVVAKRLRNAAARREKAWRWEHRGVVPDLPSQLALAAELEVSADRVTTLGWPGWLPDGDPIPACFPWNVHGSLQSLEHALEHAVLDRRGFMKLTGPVLIGLAHDWLNIETPALTSVLAGGRASDELVTQMEEGLPRLRALEAAAGGERARRLMDAELSIVTEILAKSSYSAAAGRRLHRLAAELGRIAGFASFDAGLHAAAQRYWLSALHAAHTSDDRAIGANILKSMSLQCYDFGRLQEALGLAVSAAEGAVRAAPRTEAMLMLRQARAEAALGNRAACDRALVSADRAFGRISVTDAEPSWTKYFDEAEFHAQVGTCHLDLQRASEAERSFTTALALMPDNKVRDRATYIVRASSAQVLLGETEQAAELLTSALDLIHEAPSQRNIVRALRVREKLQLAKSDHRLIYLDSQLATLTA
ncbi:transcriptional regulator [Kitasatospora acidiphila]|uniref:Transcriptional regulator n=1 Tax=Kitasatospora acidiphila TaxID=2567942 RepID=A0A540WBJ1_9ACTN|nr:transcriptional regulator [Kitasatospora acidiphila]TQF06322.1 transcriptional regulator [Kitasatospora acidiphila]